MKKEGQIEVGDIYERDITSFEGGNRNRFVVIDVAENSDEVGLTRFGSDGKVCEVCWSPTHVYETDFITNLWNLHKQETANEEGQIAVGDIFCRQRGSLDGFAYVYFIVERTGEGKAEMSRFEYGRYTGTVHWKVEEVYKLEFITNLWDLH